MFVFFSAPFFQANKVLLVLFTRKRARLLPTKYLTPRQHAGLVYWTAITPPEPSRSIEVPNELRLRSQMDLHLLPLLPLSWVSLSLLISPGVQQRMWQENHVQKPLGFLHHFLQTLKSSVLSNSPLDDHGPSPAQTDKKEGDIHLFNLTWTG